MQRPAVLEGVRQVRVGVVGVARIQMTYLAVCLVYHSSLQI